MATAGSDWNDMNITKIDVKQVNAERALSEFVMNAMDSRRAAVIAEASSSNIFQPNFDTLDRSETVDRAEILLTYQGGGIELQDFVPGRPTSTDCTSLGQFGIGLKSAVAALLFLGASISIIAPCGKFEFSIHPYDGDERTIHVKLTPLEAGTSHSSATIIRVSGLDSSERIVSKAENFVRHCINILQPLTTLLNTSLGSISVYPPESPGKKHYYVYVSGLKKLCSQPMLLRYDIASSQTNHDLFDCKDNVVRRNGVILKAITEGFENNSEAREAIDEHLPDNPSCEFNYPPMANVFRDKLVGQSEKPVLTDTQPAAELSTESATAVAVEIKVLVFFDFENAQNALKPLWKHIRSKKGSWDALVFVGKNTTLNARTTLTEIRSKTASPQAADTLLCFHAGRQHEIKKKSVTFVIVCGADGRYDELEQELSNSGRIVHRLIFDEEQSYNFKDELKAILESS